MKIKKLIQQIGRLHPPPADFFAVPFFLQVLIDEL